MDLLGTNLVTKLPQEQERGGRADPGVATQADRVEPGSLCLSPITLPELELGVLLMERRDGQQGSLLRQGCSREPCCRRGCSRRG